MAFLTNKRPIGGFYQLLKPIGTGGMGDVYQAKDVRTNQFVAVKHLKPDVIKNAPGTIERFKREGEALRLLNHPNIVKMLAAITENSQHYLVMEYVSGGSLAELLKRQPRLGVNQVLKIGLEVADALTRTHHLKIIHRDLKPANVLLAEDGTPRLTDFGIAHVDTVERVTEIGQLIGTPDYLSPEALDGAEADTSSDIWSFGVMLFEMLAGERPFTGETLSQVAIAILTKPLPDLETLCPEAPVALVDLIYRMLEKDQPQRINSVRMIGADLEAISRGLRLPSVYHSDRHHNESTPLTGATHSKPSFYNLPAQATAFVGREEEILELTTLLATPDVRLITILGPGGMGKTRLALEIAKVQLEAFAGGGIFFVSLAPLSSPIAIVSAIIEATRFSFSGNGDPKQQLLHVLRNKRMLLILDNFEHLLPGAGLVAEILEAAPAVKIIATSRSKLNLQGENLFLIQGMETPIWQTPEDALTYSAVKLFMQSAQRIQPTFTLNTDHLIYLTRICRQVEGMPLGIVLAAAWVDTLSLAEISAEIAKSLGFLETEQQNVPTRQHSIQAVFDYSWNLLSEDERKVFIKLSIFQAGFTRDAAEKVAGATLKILAALVNKSMLRRNVTSGRYSIHELLRQYAARKLEEIALASETQKAYSDYFSDYMDERWLDMHGRRQIAALREMDIEFNNLQAAWLYLLSHHTTRRIANFASALWQFFELRTRHAEGCQLFGDAVQVLRAWPTNNHSDFLIGYLLGLEAYHQAGIGALDQSELKAKEAIAILEPHQNWEALALTWCGLSLGYGIAGSPCFAQAAEQFVELAIVANSQWLMARGYLWLGLARWLNPAEAQQHFQKCLSLAQESGDVYFVAAAYLRMGNLASDQKAYLEAKQYAEQALPYFEEVGQPWSINQTENLLGDAALNLKDYITARRHFQQALKVYKEYASTNELMFFVLRNVDVLKEQTPNARAVELLSLIVHHPENANNPHNILSLSEKSRVVLNVGLPSDVYGAAWEHGKTLDLDSVIEELLVEGDYH